MRVHRPPGHEGAACRFNLEYGLPLVTPALQSQWRRELARAAEDPNLDYPPPEGLRELRAAIAGYLGRRRGIAVDPEDVLIVGGTQQAFDLVVRALLDAGDTAVLEEPHYQSTRQVVLAAGAKVALAGVDDEGLKVDELEKHDARLIFVTPSHQFPTGAVLSLPRRLALLEWARRKRAFVIEDDYDGEFRHDVKPLSALKALDRDGRVLYVGTFSKVLFPALRLGYLVVPPALREPLRAGKWLLDRGCPAIEQRALARLIESGGFERMLRRTGKLLAQRRAALLESLARHCAPWVEVGGASAGMHVALWLTRHASAQVPEIIAACAARGVAVYPIEPYYYKQAPRAGLLLGYSGLPIADIVEGTKRLGGVLREILPAEAGAPARTRLLAGKERPRK
jgi:GntR family transcriptional regulator/MocR family aminotransferase